MKIDETLCASCGYEKAEITTFTKNFGKGSNLIVIEHVPMVYCPKCNITYMTAETMQAIDQIRQNKNQIKKRAIPVAEFAS
jgi:YgiT-type zinc finger domain-containing protein